MKKHQRRKKNDQHPELPDQIGAITDQPSCQPYPNRERLHPIQCLLSQLYYTISSKIGRVNDIPIN